MAEAAERQGGWRFAIDRGGTFTDLVGQAPDGRRVVRKVLSVQPERPGDPAIRALRGALGLAEGDPLPPGLVEEVRLGTTVATNALLERQVEPVLLLVNRGLADLLRIGDQHRPDLFALHIEKPEPLPVRVVEVEGRLAADGSEVEPLRLDAALAERVLRAGAAGCRACAVALLHSYRQPAQELALGTWLEGLGFTPVLLSHRVSPQPRLVPRLATTVAEAALAPVLGRYLAQVRASLGAETLLRVMTSSGALRPPSLLLAKDTILSGPAGGMVGAVAAARAAGCTGAILGFDMGGTSTDVFHAVAGSAPEGQTAWERLGETDIGGLRLQAPTLPIHTVAAGGGSVLQVAGGRLQVGPRSAGADPGPACYRRGGPATITDANLLLGRLPARALPPVFGPGGDRPADGAVVRERFEELAQQLNAAAGAGAVYTAEAVAQGALTIAVERMAEAIRRISIQRGHDIRRAVLVSFGGAGGQHACALAASLGIRTVLVHPLAGVLSAWGIARAPRSLLREHSPRLPLRTDRLAEVAGWMGRLEAQARQALGSGGERSPREDVGVRRLLEIRPEASERGLEIPWPEEGPATGSPEPAALALELRQRFREAHRRRFGYVPEGEELVVERVAVEVTAIDGAAASEAKDPIEPAGVAGPRGPGPSGPGPRGSELPDAVPRRETVALCLPRDGERPGTAGPAMAWRDVPLLQRNDLTPEQTLTGPAVVLETTGTTLVEPGWEARVLPGGELLLERQPAAEAAPAPGAPRERRGDPAPDPVLLELYNHRFSAIAEQMGERLRQSSRSVNIRERLDFSCALFDGAGRLVANAPHIPVHLGSMGESVVALLAAVARGERPPLAPGDAIAANDPFRGGTHLPDITVITPVFAADTDNPDSADSAGSATDPADSGGSAAGGPSPGAPLFFVACRGHHADVGGITPGSMPPFSRSIEEEGLRLDNVPLLRGGHFDEEAWRRRLLAGPHPVRDPDRLLADLQAQLAANQLGVEELERLLQREGVEEVAAYMGHVQANAAEAVRRVIDGLRNGSHRVELDDGTGIEVAVTIERAARRARVDFTGTSPQQPGNGNAPLAITRAVVLYVFRCLVGEAIPLNHGCFEPIDLVVPPGCLLHPAPPAAVVAGNVETSQAVANALFAALGVMAAAQGTMNNLTFGDERRQYYETICGGSGAGMDLAGRGFEGASAVQTHMTNSRLTDPEILEERFPVRLETFAIRRGSGGAGRWRGGDGVVRRLRFLAPMTVAILSGNRRIPPFGLAGGGAARCGANVLVRADGRRENLPGSAQVGVAAGDVLEIETPGGGGYGRPVGHERPPGDRPRSR